MYALNQQGVTLRATEQPVDTRSAAGKAFLDMLGVFAEFETNLRRERQMEGIAAAKARGVYPQAWGYFISLIPWSRMKRLSPRCRSTIALTESG